MQNHTDESTNSLEESREQFGYSYKVASRLIELPTPQLLAKWEHGDNTPSLKYLMRLMALYEMNPITMYPKMYKDAKELVTIQKEKSGVANRLRLFNSESRYADYINRCNCEKSDINN